MNKTDYKNPIYLEVLAWGLLIALVLLPLFYYQQLPEQIPSYFNAAGKADAFSSKSSIWILPIIGVAVFLLLHFMSKSKSLSTNSGTKLSPEAAAQIAIQSKKILHAFKLIIPLGFLYINYTSIKIALGESNGLGAWFLWAFLAMIFGVIAYYSFQKTSE